MKRKKVSKTKNRAVKAEETKALQSTLRGDKILNVIINTSVILMSTMMGAFTQVMVNATSAMASGIASAMGGKEAEDKVNEEFTQKLPKVDEKMKAMISDIRKDIYAQMGQKRKAIEPLLTDPAFDVGPRIIERHDFKLPKLSEELDDDALAKYSQLLVSEDPRFAEMFRELTDWINSLPKIQEPTKQETRK